MVLNHELFAPQGGLKPAKKLCEKAKNQQHMSYFTKFHHQPARSLKLKHFKTLFYRPGMSIKIHQILESHGHFYNSCQFYSSNVFMKSILFD